MTTGDWRWPAAPGAIVYHSEGPVNMFRECSSDGPRQPIDRLDPAHLDPPRPTCALLSVCLTPHPSVDAARCMHAKRMQQHQKVLYVSCVFIPYNIISTFCKPRVVPVEVSQCWSENRQEAAKHDVIISGYLQCHSLLQSRRETNGVHQLRLSAKRFSCESFSKSNYHCSLWWKSVFDGVLKNHGEAFSVNVRMDLSATLRV